MRAAALLCAALEDAARLFGSRFEDSPVAPTMYGGFFNIEMFFRLQNRLPERHMKMVGHRQQNGIDFGVCQHVFMVGRQLDSLRSVQQLAETISMNSVDIADSAHVGTAVGEKRLRHGGPAATRADDAQADAAVCAFDTAIGNRRHCAGCFYEISSVHLLTLLNSESLM